jgi:hypothetical protein
MTLNRLLAQSAVLTLLQGTALSATCHLRHGLIWPSTKHVGLPRSNAYEKPESPALSERDIGHSPYAIPTIEAVVTGDCHRQQGRLWFALLEAGVAGYLLKNVRGRELIKAIRAVHTGESVLNPVVTRKILDPFKGAGGKSGGDRAAEPFTEREVEVLRLARKG